MINKIKKGGIQRYTFIAVVLAFLGIAFPLAFVDGLAAAIASHTANALAGVFLLVLSTMSLVFSTFADWFMRIAIGPAFMTLPHTIGNEFVMYGWGVVRDFVNMFFIIILIIIGLSTALQVETYRWQKTLPRLVGVALLINFTPVLLGVFTDAANIAMNYFVPSIGEESVLVSRMHALFDVMASRLAETPWTSFTGAVLTPVAMMVIFTLFNTVTGIVYLLYGGIFALRSVVIWLLVIISPFGFFCYILPATQPFFKRWWRLFIWWCIAGVSAAFFLYMGEIMSEFIDLTGLTPADADHQGMDVGRFTIVFPLMIPLLFTLFGFFATLAISSSGSKGVIEGFQTASGAAKKTSTRLPGSTFKEKTQAASASVKNAFSPGPAAAPSPTPSGEAPSSKETDKKGGLRGFLRRESIDRGQKPESEEPRSVGQVASFVSEGSESAAKDIAGDVAKISKGMDSEEKIKPSAGPEQPEGAGVSKLSKDMDSEGKIKPSAGPEQSKNITGNIMTKDAEKKKEEEVQCKGCGASVSKGTSLCPLCRKNILQEKRSDNKKE